MIVPRTVASVRSVSVRPSTDTVDVGMVEEIGWGL